MPGQKQQRVRFYQQQQQQHHDKTDNITVLTITAGTLQSKKPNQPVCSGCNMSSQQGTTSNTYNHERLATKIDNMQLVQHNTPAAQCGRAGH